MKLMNTRRAPKKIARTIRTVTVVTVLCFCLSILRGSEVVSPKSAGNDPTKLHPVTKGPMGWGIFQKMHQQQRDRITENIDSPYIIGSEVKWDWGELEPVEGQFKWQEVDKFIETWAAAGKKVILKISTSQKQRLFSTPEWVYKAGAKLVSAQAHDKFGDKSETDRALRTFPKANYPVYWDPVYLEKYNRFILALGKRYNGHPAIEMIQMGLGQNVGFSCGSFDELLDEYKKQGYSKDLWLATMLRITEFYRAAFPDTPLMVVTGPIESKWDDPDMERFCAAFAERNVVLYCHNLRGTDVWKKRCIPEIYSKLASLTKTALGCDNPTWKQNQEGGSGNDFYGDIWKIARYGIGGVEGIPPSGISYMIFYTPDITAATPGSSSYVKEYEDVMKWLVSQLKKKT